MKTPEPGLPKREQKPTLEQIVIRMRDFHNDINLFGSICISTSDKDHTMKISKKEQKKQQERELKFAKEVQFFEDNKDNIGAFLSTAEGREYIIDSLEGLVNVQYGLGAQQYEQRIKMLVGSLFTKHLDDLQACLEDPASESIYDVFNAIEALEKLGREVGGEIGNFWTERAHEFIERNATLVLNKLDPGSPETQSSTEDYFPALRLMALFGSEQLKERALEVILKIFDVPLGSLSESPVDGVVSRLIKEKFTVEQNDQGVTNLSLSNEAFVILQKILERHQIPLQEFASAWVAGMRDKPENLGSYFVRNLCSIRDLDYARPDGVKTLWKDFGILNFARYETAMMTRQFDERSDTKSPYGIVVHPREDHNGAFNQDNAILLSLSDQLKNEGYNVRVVEAKNTMDLARKLITLEQRYSCKIDFAMIGGHGTKTSIKFGQGNMGTLYAEDLGGRGVQKSSRFFAPNAPFILESCSTGAPEGLGQQLSETFGREVIAPNKPTSMATIRVRKEGDRLRFEVDYRDDNTRMVYGPETF